MRWIRLGTVIALVAIFWLPAIPTSAAGAVDRPHRVFTYAKIVKLPGGTLSFRAQVKDYPLGPIALMKKKCAACAWSRVAVRRTTQFGRVFSNVPAPAQGRWYWRYRTPATPTFALTYSSTWYTYRHQASRPA
jgi:hypothetical protein